VVASIFPLADWLGEVGGDDVDVHLLVARSANPHHFEPQVQDAVRVSHARAFFAIGLGLDPWAVRLAQNSGRGTELAFFETGAWITPQPLDTAQDNLLLENPAHVAATRPRWPPRLTRIIGSIHSGRPAWSCGWRRLWPGSIPVTRRYASRAEGYAARLKGLDERIEAARRVIPPASRW